MEFICNTEEPHDFRNTRAPLGDEIRALIVYVAFKDDENVFGGWTLHQDSLRAPPPFIDSVYDTSADPAN